MTAYRACPGTSCLPSTAGANEFPCPFSCLPLSDRDHYDTQVKGYVLEGEIISADRASNREGQCKDIPVCGGKNGPVPRLPGGTVNHLQVCWLGLAYLKPAGDKDIETTF